MDCSMPGFPAHHQFPVLQIDSWFYHIYFSWKYLSDILGPFHIQISLIFPCEKVRVKKITWGWVEDVVHRKSISITVLFYLALSTPSHNWFLLLLLLLQSWPTLCDPIDGSPPGSAPGILQERTLEWVAISFSNTWKWKVKVKSLSCVQLLATLWTAAYQALTSMGFSRQEYWSGVPLPSS